MRFKLEALRRGVESGHLEVVWEDLKSKLLRELYYGLGKTFGVSEERLNDPVVVTVRVTATDENYTGVVEE